MRKNELKRLVDAICGLSASELGAIKDAVDRRERSVETEIVETEMAGRSRSSWLIPPNH